MHPGNSYYGHRQLLAEYCDVDADRPLPRVLQHGTTLANPLLEKRRMVPWLPGLVWGSADLARAAEAGLTGATAIGAPFVYLREMLNPPDLPAQQSTILYPYHSTEKSAMSGSHLDLMSTVRKHEQAPISVCLYWVEYENVSLRRSYEDAGFRVICHGRRTDPGFLRRQFDELSRHTRVISNRVCTAVFYGGSLGRDIEVYGDVFASAGGHELARQMQVEAYPRLVGGGLSGTEAVALADRVLGYEHLQSADDLRSVTGWAESGSTRARTAVTRAEHYRRSVTVRLADRLSRQSR